MGIMRKSIARFGTAILGLATIQTTGCGESSGPAQPTTGELEIRVTTFGQNIDLDPDGYTLRIDDLSAGAIGINNAIILSPLLLGMHKVGLEALASNCVVLGGDVHSVVVTRGETPSRLSLEVSCSPLVPVPPGPWDY
jgi:hypothetical protein